MVYGWLVTFKDYQYLANKEPDSILPPSPGVRLPESSDLTVGVVPRNHAGALVSEAETESEAESRRTTVKTEAEYDGTSVKSSEVSSVKPADLTGKICTRWNERESTWRKSGTCRSRGTSQSKS
jgi:hypothetical protein